MVTGYGLPLKVCNTRKQNIMVGIIGYWGLEIDRE